MSTSWLTWISQVSLSQGVIALTALAVPFLMAEMAVLHHRGNFHRPPMYVPLVLPPFFALSALLLLISPGPWTVRAFAVLSAALVLMGVAGTFFHLQGVARQTGGFNLDNVMVGPPLVAPLGFSFVGLLGLLGLAASGGPP